MGKESEARPLGQGPLKSGATWTQGGLGAESAGAVYFFPSEEDPSPPPFREEGLDPFMRPTTDRRATMVHSVPPRGVAGFLPFYFFLAYLTFLHFFCFYLRLDFLLHLIFPEIIIFIDLLYYYLLQVFLVSLFAWCYRRDNFPFLKNYI